jgi:hypothetical protein
MREISTPATTKHFQYLVALTTPEAFKLCRSDGRHVLIFDKERQ